MNDFTTNNQEIENCFFYFFYDIFKELEFFCIPESNQINDKK